MDRHETISKAIEKVRQSLIPLGSVMDEARRLPKSEAERLAPAGMFRLLTPQSIGGPELRPLDFFKSLETIAMANASIAWCSMIASTNGISAAYFDERTAKKIFGDPNVITGGVFAPRGKAVDEGGHYRVSGRWAWGSGSANCSWLAGGCTVWKDGEMLKLPGGSPEIRMMFFPSQEATLFDTWKVMGLRGTGSGDFEVKNIEVPKVRSVSLISDKPREGGPLYKFPIFGLLALGITGVAVGNGRAAIDGLKQSALNKKFPNGKSLAEKPFLQSALAELEADWQTSRAFVVQEVVRLWDIAKSPGEIPVKDRSMLRLACTRATRLNADICRRVFELGGGDALYENNVIERRFRDAHAMTQHIMTGAGTYEMAGRVMLERPVNITMI